MPYVIECFLEVDEVIVEDTLVLQIFLYQQFYFVLLYFFLVESLPGFPQPSLWFGSEEPSASLYWEDLLG